MKEIFAVIGMSPGNGYFKQEVINQLISKAVLEFYHIGIFIPDIPAIATYIALGYPENIARREKAIPQGNSLRKKVKTAIKMNDLDPERIRIFSWQEDGIEDNSEYRKRYQYIQNLYSTNLSFQQDVNTTTAAVLTGSRKRTEVITEDQVRIGTHYLLSEFAFMLFLPDYLKEDKVAYIYHKPWPVFENFIQGRYDGEVKEKLLFVQFPDFS